MATTSNSNFNPNWASPPGNTIDELLRERKISFNTLAKNLNADTDYLNNLIHGNIPLTEEIAVKLASHLGASAKFWLNRESHYRQSVDKLRENEEKKWLNNLPISEMVKLGWIPSNYSPGLLLEYFSVSNVWAWKSKYRKLFSTTSFRSSPSFESNLMSVSAWLRKGEIEASKINCQPFNQALFEEKLIEIKKLTRKKNPINFIFDLQNICAETGVAVVFVKNPKGCTASGAAYHISEKKAIIILSFRYLSDDQFWFTFFHEAGHILLHKKGVFVEELNHDGLDDEEEKEANAFSTNILLSKEAQSQLNSLELSMEGIARFAINNGISPGILIGQLQYIGRIGYHQLNGYKRRYTWTDISSILNDKI